MARILGKLPLLGLFLWLWPVPGAVAQSYDELCERSASALSRDSLDAAAEYIRQALRQDPAHPRNALLFSNLGTIQQRQGKTEMALESYRMALNLAPTSVPILMNHGALSLQLGREGQAQADYSQVIELEPHNKEALLMRAYIYMSRRDYKFARLDYDTLLSVDPYHYAARLGLATLLQRQSHCEASLRVLDAMLADKGGASAYTPSELSLVYVARAGVALDMRHPDSALLDLEQALLLDSLQPDAYLLRARIYLSRKKKSQARHDLERALSLGAPQGEVRGLLEQCR